MKKVFLLLMLFSMALLPVMGIDYPDIMNNGTIFINPGIGFGQSLETKQECPPLMASIDFALPLAGLPVTVGVISGYFSEADSSLELKNWGTAARIAYHNSIFSVTQLDTYLLLTIGGIASEQKNETKGYFWLGLTAGARYFFLPNWGAFAELGLDKVQILSFGFTFKI